MISRKILVAEKLTNFYTKSKSDNFTNSFLFLGQRVKVENFSEAFYKPDGLYEAGMLDHIFRGMIKTHTQSEDLHVNEEMTNKMFMDENFGFGLDLVAQVIQQGRVLQPSILKSLKMAKRAKNGSK